MIRGTKAVAASLWVMFLSVCFMIVTHHTWDRAQRDYRLLDEPPLTHFDTRLINIVTLGHRDLYDDFIAIWTLQTLFDRGLAKVPPDELQKSILSVTRHGPQIESLYNISCYILSYDYGRADLCEKITADGIKALPSSWRIPMLQGYLYYSKLENPTNAALYYGLAASKSDSPPFLKKLAYNLVEKNHLDPTELEDTVQEILPPEADRGAFRNVIRHGVQHPPQLRKR